MDPLGHFRRLYGPVFSNDELDNDAALDPSFSRHLRIGDLFLKRLHPAFQFGQVLHHDVDGTIGTLRVGGRRLWGSASGDPVWTIGASNDA